METIAYLLIEVVSGEEYNLVATIRKIPEVKNAYIVYGAWDVIVEIRTKGMGELNSLVLKIRRYGGVKRSATLIALTGEEMDQK